MHSRIFQASTKPIQEYEYLSESDYWEHWFLNSVADYVVDSDDRNEDIEWLKECARGYTVDCDENGDYFVITSKVEYFKNAFKNFTELLGKIKDYTIENFAAGMHEMWGLQNAYEEKFGFYVDMHGELMSFDSFVRHCTEGEKYYIGGTLDFHC